MMMVFSALLERGDEVIISDPHYACYPNFIRFAGGEVVKVRVHEEDGFQYRPEAIAERLGERTKAVLVNSPSNPTGNLLGADRMRAIAEMAPYVVSDEIYHGLATAATSTTACWSSRIAPSCSTGSASSSP